MTHLSIETISTYLDDELRADHREQAERHLEACPACRSRLERLHLVVARLSGIGPAAAPTYLKSEVQRYAALGPIETSVGARYEWLVTLTRQQSPLLAAFGVVLALVLIIFLLASGLTTFSPSETDLIVPPPSASAPELLKIGLRAFEPRDGGWIEKGWPGGAPSRRVAFGSEEFALRRTAEPELAKLTRLDGSVWIVLDGERIELYAEDNL